MDNPLKLITQSVKNYQNIKISGIQQCHHINCMKTYNKQKILEISIFSVDKLTFI